MHPIDSDPRPRGHFGLREAMRPHPTAEKRSGSHATSTKPDGAVTLARGRPAADRLLRGMATEPASSPPDPPTGELPVLERVSRRYRRVTKQLAIRPALALRQALSGGYGLAELRRDLLAGAVVGIVALPLSMALAIASGMPPQYGIYTAIVAGIVTSLLGGSPTQVSGPTAAFVVILAPICEEYGPSGLLIASMMAGLVLIGLGLFRLGRLIQFIPHTVTTGFTAGIAVVIATLQIKDVLGLTTATWPPHYLERVAALFEALPTARWPDAVIAGLTLAILLGLPRLTTRVPAPLIALPVAAITAFAASHWIPGFHVATIATRFEHGIPQLPPTPLVPWHLAGAGGEPPVLSLALLRSLVPSAFAIAMLGAIESLLSAVVADGMAGTRHDPDAELLAQGASNLVAPFFGGFASTGAIARTATNIRAGGRTPIAAAFHGVVLLAAVLFLAPLLGYLPMAGLAALLLLVAWNMSDVRHFLHILKVAPRPDVAVLLTCFGLTVIFDMVIAVSAGVMLASLLFMSRMAELTGAEWVEGEAPGLGIVLPKGVVLYRIDGPLFFGAAQKAIASLSVVGRAARAVVIDLSAVPSIDVTGLVALESALEQLHREKVAVVLAGLRPNALAKVQRAGIWEIAGERWFAATVAAGVELAAKAPQRG
jgi:SulP family sulfate permease